MLALIIVLGGCGGKGQASNAASGGSGSAKPYAELRWGVTPFPGPINLNNNLWAQVGSIESLAVQSLVELEPDGKIKPGLASSIEHPNATTYVYNIRPGVKFSDGKPLTVADVVFSLQRNVTGKESEVKSFWEGVSSIAAQGKSAVVIKLKRPNAVWPSIVSVSSQIIEKAQAEMVGEKALGTAGHLPIGTGPWKLDSFKPEVNVQLSRNPYWTGPQPPASKITVDLFKEESQIALALRSGEIDGTFNYLSPKLFGDIQGVRQSTAPGTNLLMLEINTKRPPFNDVHVRRAIAYATDVPAIIKALYPGAATEDVTISPASLFADLGTSSQVGEMLGNLPKYDLDLAAAKRELAKSPYPHGFTMKVQALSADTIEVDVAQIVAADLAKIGIKATVQGIPLDENSNMYGNKVSVWVNEYYAFYPDSEGLIGSLLPPSQIRPPGSGLNVAAYRNAEVDKLLPEELETTDPTQRLKLLGKMLGIEGAEVPYRPLYTHDAFLALSEKLVFPTFSAWSSVYTPWAIDVKPAQ
ncbi:MAG TPA: ABC transporter substrate-binding protein [Solirubrobacteraceae bacterium]|nr:ABC transporter substrate-binding protein [Solirubrobacteraceae bacterium]